MEVIFCRRFSLENPNLPKALTLATMDVDLNRCYRNHPNEWVTSDVFEEYLGILWYPEVRIRTGKPVCLIVDYCSAHGSSLLLLEGVEYITLPLNVASVNKLMNRGIIRTFKLHVRGDLLEQVVTTLQDRERLQILGDKQKNGMRGLKYEYPAHVLDAFQTINRAILKPTSKTVFNCWLKAGILDMRQLEMLCAAIEKPFDRSFYRTPRQEAGLNITSRCANPDIELPADEDEEDISEGSVVGKVSMMRNNEHRVESEDEIMELATLLTAVRKCLISEDDTMNALSTWLEELDVHEETPAVLATDKSEKIINLVAEMAAENAAEIEDVQQTEQARRLCRARLTSRVFHCMKSRMQMFNGWSRLWSSKRKRYRTRWRMLTLWKQSAYAHLKPHFLLQKNGKVPL